jgi:hypothetical protein
MKPYERITFAFSYPYTPHFVLGDLINVDMTAFYPEKNFIFFGKLLH